jgi:hypothetical protein
MYSLDGLHQFLDVRLGQPARAGESVEVTSWPVETRSPLEDPADRV